MKECTETGDVRRARSRDGMDAKTGHLVEVRMNSGAGKEHERTDVARQNERARVDLLEEVDVVVCL
jgi:hypothetical protein